MRVEDWFFVVWVCGDSQVEHASTCCLPRWPGPSSGKFDFDTEACLLVSEVLQCVHQSAFCSSRCVCDRKGLTYTWEAE